MCDITRETRGISAKFADGKKEVDLKTILYQDDVGILSDSVNGAQDANNRMELTI